VVGARVQSSFARAKVQLTGSDASRDSLRSEFGAPGYLDKRQQGGVFVLRCGGIEQSKFSYLLSERSGEEGGCEGCKEASFLEKDTISNRMS
jgi:hypothetical protein